MKSTKVPHSVRWAFWGLISASSLFWILAILLLSSCSGSILSDPHKKPSDDTNSPRQNEAWTPAPAPRSAPPDTFGARADSSGPDGATSNRFVPKRRDPHLDTVEARVPAPTDFGDPRGRVVTAVANLELFRVLFPETLGDAINTDLDKLVLALRISTPSLEKFASPAKGELRFRALRESVKGAESNWDQLAVHTVPLKITAFTRAHGSENLSFVASGSLTDTGEETIAVSLVLSPSGNGKYIIKTGKIERRVDQKISTYVVSAGNRIRVALIER